MKNAKLCDEIFDAVHAAMQRAEEIGGPCLPDYVRLMARIATEANARIEKAVASHGYWGELSDFPDDDEDEAGEPNGCPECARSFGPHYTGPCNH